MKDFVEIYGIKNCSTVKKALLWLEAHKKEVIFHDYKKEPPSYEMLKEWSTELGWEALLNKSGTTFRKLEEGKKENLTEDKALSLMVEFPSLIRRPLLRWKGKLQLRFSEEAYESFFKDA